MFLLRCSNYTLRYAGRSQSNHHECIYSPLSSSAFAPGVPLVLAEFNNYSSILATFVVSIFILGFATGPLLIAPLSEMYGRLKIYHCCNVLFVVFTIACAVASSFEQLLAFRFLAGFAGVATVTCGSGSIADMIPREQRGVAISVWSSGPLFGPIVGPVIGGFLVEAKGWRWAFWLVAILVCLSTSGLCPIVAYGY